MGEIAATVKVVSLSDRFRGRVIAELGQTPEGIALRTEDGTVLVVTVEGGRIALRMHVEAPH
jgi:hypothetical protein